MKKKTLALMSAIALTGLLGFSSCSTSEEEVDNPNYNPETNEVKAQFVFNVATGNKAATRMTSAATQASEDEIFRGINNAVLYSYKQASDGNHLAAPTTMDKRYAMETILAEGSITKDKSHRVIETSLPLNTNTLVFYGRAPEGYAYGSLYGSYDSFGHLDDYSLPSEDNPDLSNVTFGLGQRLTPNLQDTYHGIEDLLAGILTVVMNTNLAGDTNHVDISKDAHPADKEHTTGNTEVPAYGFTVTAGNYPEDLTWASYANTDGKSPMDASKSLAPLEKKMADLYREMTNISQGTGELRSGSGPALLLIIHDLWSNINEVRCAIPMSENEAVAKFLAAKVSTTLEKFFSYSYLATDGHGLNDVEFLSIAEIAAALNTSDWPEGSTHTAFTDLGVINLNGFPWDFNIPFGATHLRFTDSKKQFSYVKDYNTSLMGDDITVQSESAITVENYCYPAELVYFGNSPIRVSNKELKEKDYPEGVANWDADDSWTTNEWSVGHVISTTHSVAMKNDINYGTALMETTVRYADNLTALLDNNHNIQKAKHPNEVGDNDEPDQEIEITDDIFKLTGVIVGGMPKRVGWDFIAKQGAKYTAYVYDRAIVDADIPASGTSVPNYTLMFDNYKAGVDHQDKIYVALEFLNNSGKDFFGEHNLIRNNTHFYLIGELDPESPKLAQIKWPTHHPLPPYDADGKSIEVPRVYMQDYMTSADFVIGKNSLKHALLTVPDLRYSSLTLGLSVDIKWQTGLNFNEIILGGQ